MIADRFQGLFEILAEDNRQMTEPARGSRSLEEMEGGRWPDPPADATRLVATAHALRRKPISALSPEDLRLLIGRNIGLPYLLPRAVDLLRADPLVEGDLYEGDLLSAALTRDRAAWAGAPQAARALRLVLSTMNDIPPGLQGEIDDFLALSAEL
ncbi:contact-dependent growth inhibition system immunity protein [Streptomyces sp. CA-251387]|uniref:contact-dependent growth inhibition system immunity protein n=1 Tax=Streptomyces sp. CA-251387 TaxID=3240064 RepID=UPI003D8D7F2C